MVFVVLISFPLFLYIVLIVRYYFGWMKIPNIPKQHYFPEVSIVISLRNEENHVEDLLESLKSQIYPVEKLEFIFVNDHSTDNTLSLLEKRKISNSCVLNMPEGQSGKKYAIAMAVSVAKGDIILASDADCTFSPYWAQKMAYNFKHNDVLLVSGPVTFKKQGGLFQHFQALEFTSLIASGVGAIGINNPIFCNGANMAYRKEVFLEVNNFKEDNIVSGDDVFLLHNVKAKYPNSVAFAKHPDTIVQTESTKDFREFINQRKRWVAKSSTYRDLASIYTSYLVFFTNLLFLSLFVMLFFDVFFIQFFVLFYFLKFLVDLFLLYPALKFFNREDLIKWVFSFELVYSFYIILIVFLSFNKKFEWKGRMHNK
tara:strand:+ start:6970 stop:8079 length:1110 start_codon:yes stop_codon:yes gene_type:complete